MQTYCPRCNSTVPEVDAAVAQGGRCPDCHGQLTSQASEPSTELPGAVAMTFGAGEAVSTPIHGNYENHEIKLSSGKFSGGLTPRVVVEQGGGDDDDIDIDDGDGDGDGDTPSAAGLAKVDDLPPAPVVEDDEDSLAPAPVIDEDNDDDAPSDQMGEPAATAPEPQGAAHLQLPSMDFSLPSFDMGGLSLQGASQDSASAADTGPQSSDETIPAHLRLPSFPEFDMPAVPGEEQVGEQAASGDDSANEGETAADGDAADEIAAKPQGGPAHLAPPPLPPERPMSKPAAPAAQPTASMADLPAFGLPNFGPAAKTEVTLLGAEAAAEIIAEQAKRSVAPYIGLLVFFVLAAGLWFAKDQIIAIAAPEAQVVAETPEDKARGALALGKQAYAQEEFDQALQHFQAALLHFPALGEAHRNLGIVFASQQKQDQAVEHYRQYLGLSPNAEDAAEVRKIVEDYETAQKKKGVTKASEEKPAKEASSKRRRR